MADASMALDLADPEELSLLARGVPFPAGILHRWFPAVTRRDHRYRFFKRDRALRRAVPVRPWDTPAVPLDRGDVEEVTGRMLPLSGISWLLEEEAQLLDAARAAGDLDEITDVFDEDTIGGARRILQRIMIMQGEAASTGAISIGTQAAPENRLQLPPVDFGVPDGNVITAPTLFSEASPNILGQFQDFKRHFNAGTGGEVNVGVAIMSDRIFQTMTEDEGLRQLVASLAGTPLSIGPDQINDLFGKRQLPRIIIDDTAVPDHNGVMRRQIPDTNIVLLPEDPTQGGTAIGATQWGLTEEAKKLERAEAIDPGNAPGIVAVPMESENPVRTGVLVTGIAMPVITQPDLVMSVKVLEDED